MPFAVAFNVKLTESRRGQHAHLFNMTCQSALVALWQKSTEVTLCQCHSAPSRPQSFSAARDDARQLETVWARLPRSDHLLAAAAFPKRCVLDKTHIAVDNTYSRCTAGATNTAPQHSTPSTVQVPGHLLKKVLGATPPTTCSHT